MPCDIFFVFQAKWCFHIPKRSQTTFFHFSAYPQVKCGESTIEVTIDKRLVTDHGLDDSQQRVSFEDYNDEACHAVSDGDNYKLTVKAPFEGCGTKETVSFDCAAYFIF